MSLFRVYIFFLLIFIAPSFLFSQSGTDIALAKADEDFMAFNYVQALEKYKKLEGKLPNDLLIKRNIITCIVNIHGDKSLAIPYLKVLDGDPKLDDKFYLDYATICQNIYQFDSAITFYNKYREKVNAKMYPLIDHYIESCENAKALMKKPVNVQFVNLGENVNGKYADYYPFVTQDQSTLYFTTRREECMGSLRTMAGYFSSDVFVSKVKKGEWQKAKTIIGPINTGEDDEVVGLSHSGKEIVLYVGNAEYGSALMHSEMQKNKNWGKPVFFNEPINTGLAQEREGCYSDDGNTLYFVSSRKKGLGEADIYFTRKLPNGEWGVPQNAGPNINTPYNEGFPLISADGKVLSFSSQGHTGMGGFDIFKSKWDESKQQWGEAVNVGYPINTPDDDMMFSLAANNRDGYLSAYRPGGFGDLDIYKVIFLDAEKPLTALVGNVRSADSTKIGIDAEISITEAKTNNLIEIKNVNRETGRYIFIVEPGEYKIEIQGKGFTDHKETITIFDKSDFTVEFEKNFVVTPKK
jgi:hypothetical protein